MARHSGEALSEHIRRMTSLATSCTTSCTCGACRIRMNIWETLLISPQSRCTLHKQPRCFEPVSLQSSSALLLTCSHSIEASPLSRMSTISAGSAHLLSLGHFHLFRKLSLVPARAAPSPARKLHPFVQSLLRLCWLIRYLFSLSYFHQEALQRTSAHVASTVCLAECTVRAGWAECGSAMGWHGASAILAAGARRRAWHMQQASFSVMWAVHRDACVSALRGGGTSVFSAVDGAASASVEAVERIAVVLSELTQVVQSTSASLGANVHRSTLCAFASLPWLHLGTDVPLAGVPGGGSVATL